MKEEKKVSIGFLKPHQTKAFQNVRVCRKACKEIVEDIVRHYEQAIVEENELSELVMQDHQEGIDNFNKDNSGFADWQMRVDYGTGEVFMHKRSIINELNDSLRQSIRNKWKK